MTTRLTFLPAALVLIAASLARGNSSPQRDLEMADEAFAQQRFDQALSLYRKAIEAEQRLPVRRQIIAQIVWCYQSLGQAELAGETFLLLARDDPQTAHFSCIPLAWMPEQPSPALQRAAVQWVAREDLPAAILLGSSHLLAGSGQSAARAALIKLASGPDRRVAQLAEAQAWRLAIATTTERELAQWEQTVARMPQELQAGPRFVLGLGWARTGRWEKAALELLRVPILHPEHRTLSAHALVEAGRCLSAQGSRADAARLFQEVLEKYPETRSAAEARMRLNTSR